MGIDLRLADHGGTAIHELGVGEHVCQRRPLDDGHHLRDKGWEHEAQGLRRQDEAHRERWTHPQCPSGLRLATVQRPDTGAEDLRRRRRGAHDDGQCQLPEVRDRGEAGNHQEEEVDEQQHRHRPHGIDPQAYQPLDGAVVQQAEPAQGDSQREGEHRGNTSQGQRGPGRLQELADHRLPQEVAPLGIVELSREVQPVEDRGRQRRDSNDGDD